MKSKISKEESFSRMAHFYDSLSVYPLEFVAYHAINVYYSRKG